MKYVKVIGQRSGFRSDLKLVYNSLNCLSPIFVEDSYEHVTDLVENGRFLLHS